MRDSGAYSRSERAMNRSSRELGNDETSERSVMQSCGTTS